MRTYRLRLQDMGINRYRYDELRAYCCQYPDKRATIDALADVKSTWSTDGAGGGAANSSPVEWAVIKRERLVHDCELIEQAAMQVDGGKWYTALLLNCCYGKPYGRLEPEMLPSSRREAYFAARRKFFVALDALKN